MNETTNLDTLRMYIKLLEDENRRLREKILECENTESDSNYEQEDDFHTVVNYKDILDCISHLDIEILILKMNDSMIPEEIRSLCANELVKRGYDLSLF